MRIVRKLSIYDTCKLAGVILISLKLSFDGVLASDTDDLSDLRERRSRTLTKLIEVQEFIDMQRKRPDDTLLSLSSMDLTDLSADEITLIGQYYEKLSKTFYVDEHSAQTKEFKVQLAQINLDLQKALNPRIEALEEVKKLMEKKYQEIIKDYKREIEEQLQPLRDNVEKLRGLKRDLS